MKHVCRRALALLAAIGLTTASHMFAEELIPLPNAGFEDDLGHWSAGDKGMSKALPEAARTGKLGLRVTDEDTGRGSSLRATPVPVTPGKSYALRFWARTVERGGVGVYFQFLDGDRKMLNTPDRRNEIALTVPSSATKWREYTLVAVAPNDAATLSVWIHSYNGAKVVADLDDFRLTELTEEEATVVKTTRTATTRTTNFPIPDPERIGQIAGMLVAEPAGVGRPARDRKAWDALAALPSAEKIIAAAETYAETPPPELPDELYLEFTRTGNRTNYQRPYGKRTGRIAALLKAECLENKGRFLAPLERDVLALCDERSWVMPAHDAGLDNFNNKNLYIDLGSSARGWLLATVDWWLQDALSERVRSRIRAEVQRRIFTPYLKTIRSGQVGRGFWWIRGTNNWNAVCNASVLGAALALIEPPRERAEFIAGTELSNPYFLTGFTDDGYCSEGMGYWNYGFGHYMMMGEMVLEATEGKLSIYENEKLPHIAAYPRNIQIQNGMAPAFADCGVNARPSSDVLALIQRRFPESLLARVSVSDPLGRGPVTLGLLGFGPGFDPAENLPPEDGDLALRNWFDQAGILVTRSAPDSDVPLGAAIKGGHNAEHHNHNDVGSYTIMHDGHAYLLDPGGEVYTRRTFSRDRYVSNVLNSYGHPVPLVAGKLQSKGGSAKATILETSFEDNADSLVMDISAAYDVPELTTLVRSFAFNRATRTITVRDNVAFSEPKAFGTALVTFDQIHRRDENTLVVYNLGKESLVVDVDVDGGEWTLETESIENPGRTPPLRVGINMAQPVLTASVQFTIRPAPLADDLPGVYRAPKINADFQPLLDRAVTIQAEALTRQTGGEVTICEKIGAVGNAFKFWDDPGHTLEWAFNVEKAGRYAVQIRYCHQGSGAVTRKLAVDGTPLPNAETSLIIPATGGWSSTEDDWKTIWLAHEGTAITTQLNPGTHTVTLSNDCGIGVNLDWIRIVPLEQ